jgi:hypothetical protein
LRIRHRSPDLSVRIASVAPPAVGSARAVVMMDWRMVAVGQGDVAVALITGAPKPRVDQPRPSSAS